MRTALVYRDDIQRGADDQHQAGELATTHGKDEKTAQHMDINNAGTMKQKNIGGEIKHETQKKDKDQQACRKLPPAARILACRLSTPLVSQDCLVGRGKMEILHAGA